MVEPFKPDWDEKTVLVEEMQRMAKRIEELEQKVAARSAEHLAEHITHDKGYQEGRQDAEKTTAIAEMYRIAKELQESFKMGYDAGVLETQLDQALERNFCHRCGKRLMSALGPVSIHTCCPPFPAPKSFRESVSQQMGIPMTPRTFDDYGNKII